MEILPLKTSLSIRKACWDGNLAFSWETRRECRIRTPKKIGMSSKNELIPMVSKFSQEKKEYEDKEIAVAKEPKRRLADSWREIHGQDDWVGMLDPFDPLLRSELIRYGDMAQACYDAYDHDPNSKYCGNCKVERSSFFKNLGWKQNGYEVTRYIYSKYNMKLPNFFSKSLHSDRWSSTANWVGYVAVSNDETSAYLGRRDITIAWRGTARKAEWIADFMDIQKPVSNFKIPSPNSEIKVHTGFLHVYTDEEMGCTYSKNSAREQILAELKRLKQKYANEELNITITGHSLGSSLAILNAYDIAESGLNKMEDERVVPICVFSFSGPRVGNPRFKERLKGLGVKVLRVLNIHDGIPKVPGIFFNEHTPKILQKIGEMLPWCYSHIGEELALDHKKSPFLKETGDRGCFHNLEAHLHLLAGYHGRSSRFWVASGREIKLVNKHSDFLKDEFLVPPNWWCTENREMIKNHIRQWKLNLEDYLPPQGVHHHLQQPRLACEE